jgi:lipopolysaccharide transport system permease protein
MLVNRDDGAPSAQVAERAPEPRSLAALERTVIEPAHGWVSLQLRELWKYRELLLFLTWRDVKVRYQQTYFGIAWAVLQPLFMMTVFSIFFGRFAKLPSDGVPYPIFAMCALIPWQLFQYSLGQSSNSLVTSQQLIKKVYFPRLVIPIASVLDGLVDLSVAFVLLVAMMAIYGIAPTANIVFLPLFVLFATVTALSVGVWLSALNVQYRDVRYTVPFISQIWMFATPVAYSSSIVPEKWRWAYGLNPMVGVVEGFRWALLGHEARIQSSTYVSIVVVAVVLTSGIAYFRRMEASFADVI